MKREYFHFYNNILRVEEGYMTLNEKDIETYFKDNKYETTEKKRFFLNLTTYLNANKENFETNLVNAYNKAIETAKIKLIEEFKNLNIEIVDTSLNLNRGYVEFSYRRKLSINELVSMDITANRERKINIVSYGKKK